MVVGVNNAGGSTRWRGWSSGLKVQVALEVGEVPAPSLSTGEPSSSPLLLPEGEVKKPSSARASSSSF